jgi:cysteine protease ATG4
MENIIIDQKNKKKYNFKKPGIIFISFRLGLNKIYDDYIEIIPKLFSNLHHNIGFVSGKENKAFYFIGFIDNKLLYVDPHLNQTSVKSDLSDIKSYYVKDIYLLNVSEISSELTIGVLINCCEDLRIFFNDLNWFLFNFPDFLRVD